MLLWLLKCPPHQNWTDPLLLTNPLLKSFSQGERLPHLLFFLLPDSHLLLIYFTSMCWTNALLFIHIRRCFTHIVTTYIIAFSHPKFTNSFSMLAQSSKLPLQSPSLPSMTLINSDLLPWHEWTHSFFNFLCLIVLHFIAHFPMILKDVVILRLTIYFISVCR